MTINSLTRSIDGTSDGTNRDWPFTFRVYDASHVRVEVLAEGAVNYVEITPNNYDLVLGTGDALNGYLGGTVTYPKVTPLSAGQKVRVSVVVPSIQTGLDLNSSSGFNPAAVERSVDLLHQLYRQINEGVGLTGVVRTPDTLPNLRLPAPVANLPVGWNSAGTALANITNAAGVAYIAPVTLTRSGTGAQTEWTDFSLGLVPDAQYSRVYVDGAVQDPSSYALTGESITFDSAPASGTDNILIFAAAGVEAVASVTPVGYEGSETLANLAGYDLTFTDKAHLAATRLNVSAGATVWLKGRTTEGTAPGLYIAVASDPGATGIQSADGQWFKLAQSWLTPEHCDAVGDNATDDSAAVQAAIDFAIAERAVLVFERMYFCDSGLVATSTLTARGNGQTYVLHPTSGPAEGTLLPVTGITFSAGNGWEFLEGSQDDEDDTIAGVTLEEFAIVDNGASGAPANRQSYDTVPLLLCHRAFQWHIRGLFIDGASRRQIGMHLGEGNTIWGSSITGNNARRCALGAVIGGTNDATHNEVSDNTFDQNLVCGVVLWNWVSGTFNSNSAEQNTGPVGCYVRSTTSRSKTLTMMGNYFFNNAKDGAALDLDGSCGLQVGGDLVWSDFTTPGTNDWTSSTNPWTIFAANNYIINDKCRHAARLFGQRGTVFCFNIVESNSSTDSNDIYLGSGAQANTLIDYNVRQSDTQLDLVTDAASGYNSLIKRSVADNSMADELDTITLAAGGTLEATASGSVGFGTAGSVTSNTLIQGEVDIGSTTLSAVKTTKVTGTASTWTTIFDLSSALPQGGKGKVDIELLIEQSNGNAGAFVTIEGFTPFNNAPGGDGDAYDITATHVRPATIIQSFQAQVTAGGLVQIRRSEDWQATMRYVAMDFTFSD